MKNIVLNLMRFYFYKELKLSLKEKQEGKKAKTTRAIFKRNISISFQRRKEKLMVRTSKRKTVKTKVRHETKKSQSDLKQKSVGGINNGNFRLVLTENAKARRPGPRGYCMRGGV